MDKDLADINRQKWLRSKSEQKQEAIVQVGASASSEIAPTNVSGEEFNDLCRIHILPVGPAADSILGQTRLQLMGPKLQQMRRDKLPICSGQLLSASNCEFVVVKAEPDRGLIVPTTDFFTEGTFVMCYSKVQFLCLPDRSGVQNDIDLFSDYLSPHLRTLSPPGYPEKANIAMIGDMLKISGREFRLVAAEPSEYDIGIIDSDTMIYVDWDTTPEFERVHIVPFQDTVPQAYEFRIFEDYLKPYLQANKHLQFSANDQFKYQGVEFKVVCCEPDGPARIGRDTTIFCEGTLHPSLRNFLPPDVLEQISRLPAGLQMLIMNTESLAYEERLIEAQAAQNRRGLSDETIQQIPTFQWDRSQANVTEKEKDKCMVCLGEFATGELVQRLPCSHVFHAACVAEWLRRSTDCPVCKGNASHARR